MSTADPRPLTANGLVIGTGAAAPPRAIAALADGQIPIGATGYPPVPGTITGGGGLVVTGGPGTVALSTRGFVQTASSGTVGGGEDTLATWTMPANTVVVNSGIHVSGIAGFGGNANTKTLRFYVGGSSTILNPFTTAPNGIFVVIDLWVWYLTNASAIFNGVVTLNTRAIEAVYATSLGTGIDWSSAMVVKFTGAGTADNDVVLYDTAMLAFRTA